MVMDVEGRVAVVVVARRERPEMALMWEEFCDCTVMDLSDYY